MAETERQDQEHAGEPEEGGAASFLSFDAWPAVKPVFRRSMADEASAFFSFSERLRRETQAAYGATEAAVPVDPPDPDDNALMGPKTEDSGGALFATPTLPDQADGAGSESDPGHDDDAELGEAPESEDESEYGGGRSDEEFDEDDAPNGDGFDDEGFYVGDDETGDDGDGGEDADS